MSVNDPIMPLKPDAVGAWVLNMSLALLPIMSVMLSVTDRFVRSTPATPFMMSSVPTKLVRVITACWLSCTTTWAQTEPGWSIGMSVVAIVPSADVDTEDAAGPHVAATDEYPTGTCQGVAALLP